MEKQTFNFESHSFSCICFSFSVLNNTIIDHLIVLMSQERRKDKNNKNRQEERNKQERQRKHLRLIWSGFCPSDAIFSFE